MARWRCICFKFNEYIPGNGQHCHRLNFLSTRLWAILDIRSNNRCKISSRQQTIQRLQNIGPTFLPAQRTTDAQRIRQLPIWWRNVPLDGNNAISLTIKLRSNHGCTSQRQILDGNGCPTILRPLQPQMDDCSHTNSSNKHQWQQIRCRCRRYAFSNPSFTTARLHRARAIRTGKHTGRFPSAWR